MASLTFNEKQILEAILWMKTGYVLDFSDRTFVSFVYDSVKRNIDDNKYFIYGSSKANRLRSFWDLEPDNVVGNLINDLLEYWKTKKLINKQKIDAGEEKLFEECKKIADRLLGGQEQTSHYASENSFLDREFEEMQLNKLGLEPPIVEILDQRIDEIKKCLKAKAALSVIFLCGSVLEGILLGVAKKMPNEFNSSSSSPKKNGKVLPFQDWTLANFIDVAYTVGLVGQDVKKFSHVLRDFRNYIHPEQQLTSMFKPDEHTAKICWQVLMATINDLSNVFNNK